MYGTTDVGRYLLVVLAAGADSRYFVATAHHIDAAERHLFACRARQPAPELTPMTMSPDKLDELREYYDNTSTGEEMLAGGRPWIENRRAGADDVFGCSRHSPNPSGSFR